MTTLMEADIMRKRMWQIWSLRSARLPKTGSKKPEALRAFLTLRVSDKT